MRKLYNYCLSLTKSVWQAEDLVQETLLKAYKVKSCEPGRILTISFLYTTAKNLFIDEKRRRRDTFCIGKIFMG
ncbi:RNA polymerase sigma factor [Rossellomorea aquimaris]|nr:RNA polymerase sigma factor [Rossellomorea aquimaris]